MSIVEAFEWWWEVPDFRLGTYLMAALLLWACASCVAERLLERR